MDMASPGFAWLQASLEDGLQIRDAGQAFVNVCGASVSPQPHSQMGAATDKQFACSSGVLWCSRESFMTDVQHGGCMGISACDRKVPTCRGPTSSRQMPRAGASRVEGLLLYFKAIRKSEMGLSALDRKVPCGCWWFVTMSIPATL